MIRIGSFGWLAMIMLISIYNVYAGTEAKFGIITDVHHTDKIDTLSRIYSAGMLKTSKFIREMEKEDVDFIIELGDLVDTLNKDNGKDPVVNLMEVERVFKSFSGPSYHVLGNHEFDNLTRKEFLSNIDNSGIAEGKTYYSFNSNGLHCIVLDADYTVAAPHRPFDMNTADDTFWDWKDAWIPQEELDWLKTDLSRNNLPTVVFSHQVIHRDVTENHTIKNADVLRGIMENNGNVVAVFSGHDHSGEQVKINGINYFVLKGNVGFSQDWPKFSETGGANKDGDNQYAVIEVNSGESGQYRVSINGNGFQESYTVFAGDNK